MWPARPHRYKQTCRVTFLRLSICWPITILTKAQQVEPGLIHAVLRRDDWVAEIDIPYTATSYSIKYANSVNLDYNAQKHVIHRNFNKWLTNLRQIIDAETVRADVK